MAEQQSFDVAVVGGGAIGLAIAWRAAGRGLRVVLLERDQPGAGASRVAAGMLAPITEARLTEQPLLHLGIASAAAYPAFVGELEARTGVETAYERCGTLVVARDGDDAEALERELELRLRLGLPVTRLRASQARRLEPGLAPVVRLALEVADDHAVDPRRLCRALALAAAAEGVEIRPGVQAAAIECSGSRVTGVRLDGDSLLAAEQVVIATGAWTQELAGIPAHARVPVHPVKGQLLRLHDPAGPGLVTRVIRVGGAYLVPRTDGRYVLGATMEERGFDTTVTAGAMFELLRDAAEVVPGISELVVDELSAGLRPATADGTPAIGPGAIEGLHWAAGHYRNGILLAPITAEIVVASLLSDKPPELPGDPDLLRAFDPRRFAPRPLAPVPVQA